MKDTTAAPADKEPLDIAMQCAELCPQHMVRTKTPPVFVSPPPPHFLPTGGSLGPGPLRRLPPPPPQKLAPKCRTIGANSKFFLVRQRVKNCVFNLWGNVSAPGARRARAGHLF